MPRRNTTSVGPPPLQDGTATSAAQRATRHPVLGFGPAASIPDRLFFRIGEVARLCDVPPYVLRFWETEFPMLRPGKAGTGQRLFRRRDAEMALRIRHLLYEEGYTIQGARQLLKAEARPPEASPSTPPAPPSPAAQAPLFQPPAPDHRSSLLALQADLQTLRNLLAAPPQPRRHTTPPPSASPVKQ